MDGEPSRPSDSSLGSTRTFTAQPAPHAVLLRAGPTLTLASSLIARDTIVARLDLNDTPLGTATLRGQLLSLGGLATAVFTSPDVLVPAQGVLSLHILQGGRDGLLSGLAGTSGVWRIDARVSVPSPPATSTLPPATPTPPLASHGTSVSNVTPPTPPSSNATNATAPSSPSDAFAAAALLPRMSASTGAALAAIASAAVATAAVLLVGRP